MTTVCFVGAGSAEFTRQLLRDLLSYDDLGPLTLVMHDIDPGRLELAEGLARIAVDRHGRAATIRGSLDRAEALAGADFVINAVNIGGHAATLTDFEVPARFGLNQTIADTLGVGGIFRGLRTFGFLDGLAGDMRARCPDAWLLNYTNPMAMNVQFLHRRHPELKVLGLCHSVFWTVHDLCALVGVDVDDVTFHSAGVNHQAWVLRWERGGEDLYPALDRRIAADPELGRRVRVDMYRRLGYYPTETSEHSAEYVPWYLHDPREIERLRIPIDDYVAISAGNLAEIEALIPQVARGEYVEPDEEAAEYAPQVIHSLVTGQPRTVQVNVANTGLIANLPADTAVEVPCLIDADGAAPVAVGDLPAQCAALNRAFLAVVDLTVRAWTESRPDHIRHAMMADPNTAASLSLAADLAARRPDGAEPRAPPPPGAARAARRAGGLTGRDVDDVHGRPQPFDGLDVLGARLGVGHDVGGRGDVADLGEPSLADLAGVRHHDDPTRSPQQGSVGVGLHLVVSREAGSDAHPVDTDDCDVDVDVGQRQLGERADQLVGLAARAPAAHDQLDVRPHGELGGDVQRAGDHPQALPAGQRPGDLGGRRAAVDPHRSHVGRDQLGGAQRDRPLGVVPLAAAVPHRELVEDSGRDRAAVGAGEQLLLFEQVKVAADRRLRQVEVLRQLLDPYRPGLVELLQDDSEAVFPAHARTIRASGCSFRALS